MGHPFVLFPRSQKRDLGHPCGSLISVVTCREILRRRVVCGFHPFAVVLGKDGAPASLMTTAFALSAVQGGAAGIDRLRCLCFPLWRFSRMSTTMQAVVKAQAAPGVELREVPVPTPGACEVLVRVTAASVCGTDLHIYNWDHWAQGRIQPPLIPGHEFCGVVAAVGRGVTAVKEG